MYNSNLKLIQIWVKIASLSWNLVLRLTWLWWIQWWCSFLLFLIGRTIFSGKFVPKNQNCTLKLKFRLIRICRIWWWFSIFPFLDQKYYVRLIKLVQKVKTFILSWNLVPGLFQYVKFYDDVPFFLFSTLFASFIQKICWHFNGIPLNSQQFTRRDLKHVAFLVLPCKAILHVLFFFFLFQAFKPLVTTLFIQLFCNSIFTFSILFFFFFWNRQTFNFQTFSVLISTVRIVRVHNYTMGSQP